VANFAANSFTSRGYSSVGTTTCGCRSYNLRAHGPPDFSKTRCRSQAVGVT
jgi:hypothetical protein